MIVSWKTKISKSSFLTKEFAEWAHNCSIVIFNTLTLNSKFEMNSFIPFLF
jgi:hypothetical protein